MGKNSYHSASPRVQFAIFTNGRGMIRTARDLYDYLALQGLHNFGNVFPSRVSVSVALSLITNKSHSNYYCSLLASNSISKMDS